MGLGLKFWYIVVILAIIKESTAHSALYEFAEGNKGFTSSFYRLLANNTPNSIIFSPLSAQIILGQTSDGTRGTTSSQLIAALQLPNKNKTHAAIQQLNFNISTETLKLISANKLFIDNSFQIIESFQEVSREVYKSETESVDFDDTVEAAESINTWVEDRTDHKIQNLIDPNALSSSTKLVLVNTLYLNAKWKVPFLEELTKNSTFYLNNGSTITVEMMNSNINGVSEYNYFNSLELEVAFLRLNIIDTNLTMTFVLPNKQKSFSDIENNLKNYLEPQNYSYESVEVSIPRFQITSDSMNLKDFLEKLGVTDLFDEVCADMSGISTDKGLFVNSVLQKAFINVTETGVEAAAATSVSVIRSAVLPPPTIKFVANRPFLYYISDKESGIVFFVGRYTGV